MIRDLATSLRLDRATLSSRRLPPSTRARFVLAKYRAISAVLAGRSAHIDVGPVSLEVRTVSEIGTLHSSMVDTEEMLVAAGVLVDRERPVVVDVGANIGQFTASVLLHAPSARVVAFEPSPSIHELLVANMSRADGVRVVNAGVSDAAGVLPFHEHVLPLMSSFERPAEADLVRVVPVPTLPLDGADEVPDGPIDLVKIDVEGFEAEVLRGAAAVLRRTSWLLVELSLNRPATATNLDVLSEVHRAFPEARIVRFGRPLGPRGRPVCADVLVDLRGSR